MRILLFVMAFALLAPATARCQSPCDDFSVAFTPVLTGLSAVFEINDPLAGAHYEWSFGDGNGDVGHIADHTYAAAGPYQVCVLGWWPIPGTSDTCFADTCVWIEPTNGGGGPCDDFSVAFTPVLTGLSAVFEINDPLAGAHYEWSFGDGSGDVGHIADHTYAAAGPYQVCVLGWWPIPGTSDTCFADTCVWIEPTNGGGGPCDDFSVAFTPVLTGLSAVFEINDPLAGAHYEWSFGDGNGDVGHIADHTYAAAGPYQVCVLGWWPIPGTSDTCFADTCVWIEPTNGGGGPCDDFSVAFTPVLTGLSAVFEINDPLAGAHYEWSFGDGNGDVGHIADHTYAAAGPYQVCVFGWWPIPGTSDTCFADTCVWIEPTNGGGGPCDDFSVAFTPVLTGLSAVFEINDPLAGAHYEWSFGDGNGDVGHIADHTYAAAGPYQVCVFGWWPIPGTSDTCFADTCVWIEPVVSINELGAPQLNIWPVPFNDVIHLEQSGLAGALTITLEDLFGRVIDQRRAKASTSIQLTYPDLPAGCYLLTVLDGTTRFAVRTIKE